MRAYVNPPIKAPHLDLGSGTYGLANIARESSEYRNWLRGQGRSGRHLIFDNAADELGEGMSGDEYWDLIEEIKPDEVICPDVLGDGAETVNRTRKFIEEYKTRGATFDLMAVAQGQSLEEFEICLAELQEIPEITIIGVPYDINFSASGMIPSHEEKSKRWALYREELVKHLIDSKQIKREIHLLGMSRLDEFLWYTPEYTKHIRSSDTTAPFAAAVESRMFEPGESGPKDWKALDFHLEPTKQFERMSRWNLFEYFVAVRDGKAINNLSGGVIYG